MLEGSTAEKAGDPIQHPGLILVTRAISVLCMIRLLCVVWVRSVRSSDPDASAGSSRGVQRQRVP